MLSKYEQVRTFDLEDFMNTLVFQINCNERYELTRSSVINDQNPLHSIWQMVISDYNNN